MQIETLRALKGLRDAPAQVEKLTKRVPQEYNSIRASLGNCAAPGTQGRISKLEQQAAELSSLAPACAQRIPEISRIPELKQLAAKAPTGSPSPKLRERLRVTHNEATRLKARAKDGWLSNSELKAEIVRLRRTAREIEVRGAACDPALQSKVRQVVATIDSIPIPGERGVAGRRRAVSKTKVKKESFFDKLFGGSVNDENSRGRLAN